jgi:ubiquinone/menaquinone biosynthesis C-methylase UbiE
MAVQNSSNYHPEPYWSEVAERIDNRDGRNVIAGDDEPYYRYKRVRFLEMLRTLDFNDRKVLELGAGPGGNLEFIMANYKPKSLTDADISAKMLEIAASNIKNPSVQFVKIDGQHLPFDDLTFDFTFTATVLQHNTDDKMLRQIIGELCRVSSDKIAIFEKIEQSIKGDSLCIGRPTSYYAELFGQHGFKLVEVEYINIFVSYWICGIIRKLLNSSTRQEGEPLNAPSVFLQNMTLPLTKILDKIFKSKTNIGKLVFKRA